jgi:plasmid maintenance system killer protein
MANLNIEMPDDLVRSLEGIAAAQRKSVQRLGALKGTKKGRHSIRINDQYRWFTFMPSGSRTSSRRVSPGWGGIGCDSPALLMIR